MTEFNEKRGVGRGALVCTVVVLALAVVGLVIGIAIVAAQLSQLKDDLARKGDDGKKEVTEAPEVPGGGDGGPDEPYLVPTPEQISLGKYAKAVVSCEHDICNRIGASMFAQGGSAVDAIIAAELCVGVQSPQFMGIGGGFLMTIYDKPKNGSEKVIRTLNAREVAPLAATENMFKDTGVSSVEGGQAIAVPGDIAGLYTAWEEYGKLPWRALFDPVIQMTKNGFDVSGPFHGGLRFPGVAERFERNPTIRDAFYKDDGTPLEQGDFVKMEKLSATLKIIAEEGMQAFYDGSLTQDIVNDIQDAGGIITAEDLKTYKAIWRDPVETTLDNGGYTLYGPPPPSSEVIVQFVMNILDGFNWSEDETKGEAAKLKVHHLAEALKFGYGKRSALGDRDFVDVEQMISDLISGAYGDSYRAKIKDSATSPNYTDYEPAFLSNPESHTSHLSVIGDDGSAVSMTSTINTFFGSKVMGSRTGIIFNNEMDDFSTPNITNFFGFLPSPTNFIEPGKRPMSSMSPTIVLDKDNNVRLVVGAAGGSRIITGILQTMINDLWLGMPLDQAVAAPRLHHQLFPDQVDVEKNMPQELRDALTARGHVVNEFPGHMYFSNVMAAASYCNSCTGGVLECNIHCIHGSTDWRAHSFDVGLQRAARTDGF